MRKQLDKIDVEFGGVRRAGVDMVHMEMDEFWGKIVISCKRI